MPRNLHADVITALNGDNLKWITLIEIVFDAATLRLCNRLTTIDFDGNTYSGLGSIGTVGSVSENINLDPEKCTISLSGVDPTALGVMVNNDHLGRNISIRYALLDASNQIIGEPIVHFQGSMNSLEVLYGGEASVEIEAADQLADWDRIYAGRLTDEDQQALYPFDRCLAYISRLAKKTIIWPDRK
tara:strand:- start:297 stop:857 length:561 start_codon:yes stop_codon:yes gene_type:complete